MHTTLEPKLVRNKDPKKKMSADHKSVKCNDVKNVHIYTAVQFLASLGSDLQSENGQQKPGFPYVLLPSLFFIHVYVYTFMICTHFPMGFFI